LLDVDTTRLERDGFARLGKVVSQEELDLFEAEIAAFSQAQIAKLGLRPTAAEGFIDVFRRGGAYTERIYKLLERLWALERMSTRIGQELEAAGFLRWADIRVPLIWPNIRADLPNDSKGLLPVHQDFRSMQCTRAWRLWIALRPANEYLGTMAIYPGTHRGGVIYHNVTDRSKPVIDPAEYAGVEPVVLDLPAGEGALINPLCLHASVPNRSDRTKFTLLVQVQDYAAVIDPDDETDDLARLNRSTAQAASQPAAG
jgi:hypothetical protein